MPDIVKWTETVSYLSAVAVVAGSFVAGLLGIRYARRYPRGDDQRASDIQALEAKVVEEARLRVEAQTKLRDADLREDFGKVVASARQSFEGELKRIDADFGHEIGALENQLRDLEKRYNALNVEVEVMKRRRPSRDRYRGALDAPE